MFKVGDRVTLIKPGFFVKGNGTIVPSKRHWSDNEHKTLGIRFDEYNAYGSETDFHNILIKPDPRIPLTPSIEDITLIYDRNDILKGML